MISRVNKWAARLDWPDAAAQASLARVYGEDSGVLAGRLALARACVAAFHHQFGDQPARLFRSPGRINLRGMHVDTHGGCLNLMTHQREVVVAATPASDGCVTFVNVNPAFHEVSFAIQKEARHPAFAGPWLSFITHPDVQAAVAARPGCWGNYLKGCALSVQHRFPQLELRGMRAALGSDLPRGASLSSSAALCVAVTKSLLALNGLGLGPEDLILAARDAEWYTGSRCGVSDQAAMVIGGRNDLVNVVLLADHLDTSTARRIPFPESLRVLVINSFTERCISGANLLDYTRNRFAYSLAMDVLSRELAQTGTPRHGRQRLTLASLAAEIGDRPYRVLRSIPERVSLDEIRTRYALPSLDVAYHRYFGGMSESLRPTSFDLRGPLLFAIAESERARLFLPAIESGRFAEAGRLMTIGHDGDRRVSFSRACPSGAKEGVPYHYDISDAALDALAESDAPIHLCAGVYAASSPVLDALVDAALDAGALGASLTGAGIAGAVLALCAAEDADSVAETVRARLASAEYARLAGRTEPLTDQELAEAVIVNHAPAPAGELLL